MQKPIVGIIGYGQFGQFMAKHLKPYATIVPFKRDSDPKTLMDCSIIIFAVPWDSLEAVIKRTKGFIAKDALILDVTSVKQKPLALLAKHFKKHARIGTHPIFGPQSGKHGIKGLPIVLTNESAPTKTYQQLKRFLQKELELRVIEMTAKEHDHEMAQIQGLTHFIGRALLEMNIQSFATNTKSYKQLLELVDLLRFDSWELFATIQNSNPEAKKIRRQLQKTLASLESRLV